jgi:mannose-1-phosphate guanylyltransferase/mannose-6-phosphate isomerase
MALHPVILAGGSGTRLWPLSREYYPKQFLALTGQRSMLQETLRRLDGFRDVASPIIVCNEEHRFLVAEHTRQLGKTTGAIILEPVGRNTAPALTLAALSLTDASQGSAAKDPILLVMPADHVISDVSCFQSIVQQGATLAEEGCLVTFGIVPTSPKTGYGYIKKGPVLDPAIETQTVGETGDDSRAVAPVKPFRIASFVEKPDRATAEEMLKSGEYLWNSGIFMMRASVWQAELSRYRPDIAEACQEAHARGHWDGDFYRPDAKVFTTCPSDSIDYAVIERAAGAPNLGATTTPECVVLPLDVGWSDVGAWSALWDDGSRDAQGNVIQGDVYAQNVRDSLLIGRHRLLAAVGLDDVIVVETTDAVLVASKEYVQDVKELVARLKAEGRLEQENHRKVHRPWGSYETVDSGPRFQVKRLTINPGGALSLQLHHHRAEHWVVVTGSAKVTRGDEEFILTENQSTDVPVGETHRLENPGPEPLEIIEVQSGNYLGEDDIVRFDDRYNRHKEDNSSSDG